MQEWHIECPMSGVIDEGETGTYTYQSCHIIDASNTAVASILCTTNGTWASLDNFEYNSKLVASAPKMLSLLKGIANAHSDESDIKNIKTFLNELGI